MGRWFPIWTSDDGPGGKAHPEVERIPRPAQRMVIDPKP